MLEIHKFCSTTWLACDFCLSKPPRDKHRFAQSRDPNRRSTGCSLSPNGHMLVAAPVPEVRTFTLWWISCCRRHLGGRYCWMVAGYVRFMQQLIRSRRSLYFRAKGFHHYQCAVGIVFHLNSEALVQSQVSEEKIALLVSLLIYPCQHPMGHFLPQIDKSKAIFLPAIQNQHHFPWDSLGKFVCTPPTAMLNLNKFLIF